MNKDPIKTDEMEEQINKINHKIDGFQEKLEGFPSEVKADLNTVIGELRLKKAKLKNRIDHFKGATDSAYRDMQTGVQMAWEDLFVAYDSAKERFDKIS